MNAINPLLTSLVLFSLCGCISVPSPQTQQGAGHRHNASGSREAALSQINQATDAEQVDQAIEALEKVLEQDTTDLEILARLSNLYIFKGAAYETSVRKKKAAYVKALHFNEIAMMTSPEFRREIEAGKKTWDAVAVLDETYLPAMSFWVTALFYQFDECLNKTLKPFNLRWVRRAEQVLARAYALGPDWGGGQLHFTYGIYYLMPAIAGGDMEKSEAYFEKAVACGPDWLLNRWGRARYYYGKTGDRAAAMADLQWVLAQDAAQAPGPVFWNLYCQSDARELLEKLQ
ncbi:TRAP transporter TatT component family protein [Pontiella desulfatans]|nr:TRAP transporter TatT component family protein [Pontiella desulfatans]